MSSGRAGSDQLKAHTRICGVFGLFVVLLVAALVLINQSPSLTEPDSVYADFSHSYLAAVFLLVSTTVYPHRRPGLRARKIQEASP